MPACLLKVKERLAVAAQATKHYQGPSRPVEIPSSLGSGPVNVESSLSVIAILTPTGCYSAESAKNGTTELSLERDE